MRAPPEFYHEFMRILQFTSIIATKKLQFKENMGPSPWVLPR